MPGQETYSIPFDDTIDRLVWFMRDGLGEAITEAKKHLEEFPEYSILSVRIRKSGSVEEAVCQNHPREQLESALDSLNEALEERMFAAMDNMFIPYPKKSGERESFGRTDPEMRAFGKVRAIVYPHLVLLAKRISQANNIDEKSGTAKEISALCRPTPVVTPETILTELLRDAREENTQ
ncbi:MAG: hypothetical protein KBD19_03585 [Candidatus Moranbacteria bacterium]|nr:hypothetical protein [Candidatus Moranbacteria bacterium]